MVTINRTTEELKMSQHEIEEYARRFLKETYNLELTIPIVINGRLTRALGSYVTTRSGNNEKPVRIELSKKHLEYSKIEDIQDTIKHEIIHHALHLLGKPFDDGHPIFESELKKHCSIRMKTVYVPIERNVRVYRCKCDEYIYLRTITPKYCTVCNHDLTYVGRRKQFV